MTEKEMLLMMMQQLLISKLMFQKQRDKTRIQFRMHCHFKAKLQKVNWNIFRTILWLALWWLLTNAGIKKWIKLPYQICASQDKTIWKTTVPTNSWMITYRPLRKFFSPTFPLYQIEVRLIEIVLQSWYLMQLVLQVLTQLEMKLTSPKSLSLHRWHQMKWKDYQSWCLIGMDLYPLL